MRNSYNTKTKSVIDDEIINFPNGFTIKEFKSYLDNKGIKVGLTTIYRRLELLEEKNIVKKYFDENNISKYKYTNDCLSERHFYLKCAKCGVMKHIDCDCIEEYFSHVALKHKFYINITNNIFIGLCDKCKNFISI